MYISAPDPVRIFADNFSLLPEAQPHPARQGQHHGSQLKREITNLDKRCDEVHESDAGSLQGSRGKPQTNEEQEELVPWTTGEAKTNLTTPESFLVVQWVRDLALSPQQLGSLLCRGLDPQPKNFHVPRGPIIITTVMTHLFPLQRTTWVISGRSPKMPLEKWPC